MKANTTVWLQADDHPVAETDEQRIIIYFGGGPQLGLTMTLPLDDDDAEAVLRKLEAALDDAVGYVRARRNLREEAMEPGAGAAVEAYRG